MLASGWLGSVQVQRCPACNGAWYPRDHLRVLKDREAHGDYRWIDVDLAEVALLSAQKQRTMAAIVIDVDDRGAQVQLCDLPVVVRIAANHVAPGDEIRVRVVSTDIPTRTAKLERVA